MKMMSKISTAAAALALLSVPAAAQQGGNGGGGNGALVSYINSLPLETLDATELADLAFMREEEKVARDVYRVMYQTWGLQIFDNISQAEQGHMNLTLIILNRYGIADPVLSDATGDFSDPRLANIYTRLVTFGQQSELNAMLVGAIIEDFDIFDVEVMLGRTDNRDFRTVLQNLARGSRNHMRAFYRQLENRGYTFQGLRIPTPVLLAIVNSATETRAVDENGDVLP